MKIRGNFVFNEISQNLIRLVTKNSFPTPLIRLAIDIADPSRMQDACHVNFVIDLAHRGVSVALVVEHRSVESEGLKFYSSWGLRIFSLSHALDKMKNIFLYFFTELKTYLLSYFYLQTLRYRHC